MQPTILLRVTDVYDRTYFVSQEDYESPRVQIPLRFSTGLKYSHHPIQCRKGSCTIHRENIANVKEA